MDKNLLSNNMIIRIEAFYSWFRRSILYYIIMFLSVLFGLLFLPTGKFITDIFSKGPFIAGPYIMLILMAIVFCLYKNIYLYLFHIILFGFSSLISFIGIAMGSEEGTEVLVFFYPIIIFLIINICIAIFTYKYKKEIYKS